MDRENNVQGDRIKQKVCSSFHFGTIKVLCILDITPIGGSNFQRLQIHVKLDSR
jgi:hypothetical protein